MRYPTPYMRPNTLPYTIDAWSPASDINQLFSALIQVVNCMASLLVVIAAGWIPLTRVLPQPMMLSGAGVHIQISAVAAVR